MRCKHDITMAHHAVNAMTLATCLWVLVLTSMGVAQAQVQTQADNHVQTSALATEFTADVPQLIEQAELAGIHHRYGGAWEYFVGGGLSSFDCNQDRLPDLYIAGGEYPAQLFINRSAPGGVLKFDKLDDAELPPNQSLALTQVLGSYPIDIDNDGYQDLVVLRAGENTVFKGAANCRFKRANTLWRFAGGNAWTTAFSATFEAGKRYPTLALGNYVDRSAPGSPWGTCHDNELHRADDTADTPIYTHLQPLAPGYCALSLLFTDWNRSGTDALRVTNDRHYYRGGQEQLWRLDSGAYPRLYSAAEGWEPLVIWGMGIAQADLDADGYPEYALTSMGDTKLQVLDIEQAIDENRPTYEDMAWTRGATAHRPYTGEDLKPSTGWHAQFEDINNDAQLDLFITKGNVENMNDFARFDPDNLLLGTYNNTFSEQGLAAGVALDTRGRGASVVDLNADGLLDIVVVNRGDNVSVFRHTGMQIANSQTRSDPAQSNPVQADQTRPGGNWLKIQLQQAGDNRHAIGARVSIKTGNLVQSRRLTIGGGHASGAAGFIHVGLGVAERATIRVQWPDGQWSAAYKVFANHHVMLERDKHTVTQWFPANPTQPQ